MAAIDNTIEDVKAHFEDSIYFLVESLGKGQIRYERLRRIVAAIFPNLTGSELLEELFCMVILKKTIEEKLVDSFFMAAATDNTIDTRSAIILALTSCVSLKEIFSEDILDKAASKIIGVH